jgi:hypothetical protein
MKKKPQSNESAYLNDPVALTDIKTITAQHSTEQDTINNAAAAIDSRRGSKTDSINNNQGVEFSPPPTGRKSKASKGDDSKLKGRKKSKGKEGHISSSKPPSASNSLTENSIAEGHVGIRENSGRHLNSDGKSTNDSRRGSSHPTTAADKGRSIAMIGNNRKSNSTQLMDDEASMNSFSSYENNSTISDGYPTARNDLINLLQEKEHLLAKQERELETELKKRVKEYIRNHGIGFGNSSTIATVSSSGIGNINDMNDSLITGESNKVSGSSGEEQRYHQADSIHFPHVDLVESVDGGLGREMTDLNSSLENNDYRQVYHPSANSQSINLSSFVDFPDSETNAQRVKTGDDKSNVIDQDMNNLDSFLIENGLNDAAVRNELEVVALTSGGKASPLPSRFSSSKKQPRIPSREGGNRLRDLRQYPADMDVTLKETTGDALRASTFRQELHKVKTRLRATDPNNKLYSAEGIPEIDQMIETIYNNVALSGSKAVPQDWKLIQIATTDQLKKPVTQATSTSTDDLEDFVTNKQHQLPVYDNQANILITRTYKPSLDPTSFEEKLRQSANPLHFLYQHYSDYLSQLQKDRLFFAAVSAAAASSSAVNDKIQEISNTLPQRNRNHIVTAAHHILTISKKLLDECTTLLPLINAIETLVNDSVQIVKTIQRSGNNPQQLNDLPPQNYLINSLSDLFR